MIRAVGNMAEDAEDGIIRGVNDGLLDGDVDGRAVRKLEEGVEDFLYLVLMINHLTDMYTEELWSY